MAFRIADDFIQMLSEAGIVPRETTHVIIEAKVGEITRLHFSTVEIDEDKLKVIASVVKEVEVVTE